MRLARPGKLTLREILLRPLLGFPCVLALLGTGACSSYGEGSCGNQIVLVQRGADLPDGGLDCSVCGKYGSVVDCRLASANSKPVLECNVEYFCGGL